MTGLVVDIIDLPRQAGSTKTITRTVPAPEELGTQVMAVPESSPIDVDATLVSMDDGVLVRGHAHLLLHAECVRCLRDIDEERDLSFDELYFTPEAAAAQADEGDDEADDLFILGETDLDLEPAIRDALILDLPFQPLCDPDCAGLCPDCGQRLDDLPDDHHHEVIDARWSALASLLPQGDDGQAQDEPGAAASESSED